MITNVLYRKYILLLLMCMYTTYASSEEKNYRIVCSDIKIESNSDDILAPILVMLKLSKIECKPESSQVNIIKLHIELGLLRYSISVWDSNIDLLDDNKIVIHPISRYFLLGDDATLTVRCQNHVIKKELPKLKLPRNIYFARTIRNVNKLIGDLEIWKTPFTPSYYCSSSRERPQTPRLTNIQLLMESELLSDNDKDWAQLCYLIVAAGDIVNIYGYSRDIEGARKSPILKDLLERAKGLTKRNDYMAQWGYLYCAVSHVCMAEWENAAKSLNNFLQLPYIWEIANWVNGANSRLRQKLEAQNK